MADADNVNVEEAPETDAPEAEVQTKSMDLTVEIDDVGPCKKHVRVSVPRSAIEDVYAEILEEYTGKAEVPGFRVGHVPQELVRRRFKEELADRVKQRVLLASLEELGEQSDLDPINEPNLDLESIDIPEEGDFEYEFDVEVRPEFDLPNYKGLKIERPARETSDADVSAYIDRFLEQYGKLVPVEEAADAGDHLNVDIETIHNGKPLAKIEDVSIRIRPVLRFQDAELTGFDELMKGAAADDTRETEIQISSEADTIEMRGEKVTVKFTVLDVKRLEVPALDESFLERIGAESEEDLRDQIKGMLERQVTYQQRQACREQVLEQITDSASWDLPEDLVSKQVDNALRREILEMQQAGFTTKEILARENELRQQSLTMTKQNLKQHFVLDRIAEEENLEVTNSDLEFEIQSMAIQRGENPRRVRARLIKSGAIENLEAQIRERKAVDVILKHADFTDVDMDPPTETKVEALNRSLCRAVVSADVEEEDEVEGEE